MLERVLPLGLLALSVTAAPWLMFSSSGIPRLRALEVERAGVDEEVSRLSAEIRRLRAEVERAKTDPAAVERTARDELGLVRRTELVLQFEN